MWLQIVTFWLQVRVGAAFLYGVDRIGVALFHVLPCERGVGFWEIFPAICQNDLAWSKKSPNPFLIPNYDLSIKKDWLIYLANLSYHYNLYIKL